jgi:anti-sigma B factor antagonist
MKFTESLHDGVTVIRLAGNLLGGPDATVLKTRLQELLAAGTRRIVVDLRDVEFMNSSGLAMLINGLTTLKSAGGDLKIAGASEKIATLIKVTKLATVFPNHASVKDAVAAFGA